MSGWIKIHRRLKKHWLWQDEQKLKWWIDILLEVNYESKKVLIKGTLIECSRGQSVKSLDTWAKEWRTTKKTVSSFFKMLAADGMLITENLKITTRLTVCNYETYQVVGDTEETLSKRTGYAEDTQSKRTLPPTKEVKEFKQKKESKEGEESDTSSPEISGEEFRQMLQDNSGHRPAQNFGDLSPAEMLLQSSVKICLDLYFSSEFFKETRSLNADLFHMDETVLQDWAEVFNRERITDGEPQKTLKDWASHFKRWMNLRKDLNLSPSEILRDGWQKDKVTKASESGSTKLSKNLSELEIALAKNNSIHESGNYQN